jgi:cyclohexanecarboxylate-CoA ligase
MAQAYRHTGLWSDTLIDSYLTTAAVEAPEAPAVIDRGRQIPYGELYGAVARATAGLRRAGVSRGDVVSWILPNWGEAVILHFAAVRLGAISNPIVPIYRHREVGYILGKSRSRVLVAPAQYRNFDYAAMVNEIRSDLPDLEHVFLAEGEVDGFRSFAELLAEAPQRDTEPDPLRTADDPILLLFTSGTTADPKGVIHSHNTLVYENRSVAALYGLTSRDVVFMPSPVTHITGLLYGVHLPPMLGASVVFQDSWDPVVALELLEKHGATFVVGATPFLHGLVHRTNAPARDLRLRVFACGGADVPPELVRTATETLGCCVARVYGSTEYPTLTASGPADELDRRAVTDGRPIGPAQMRIVDAHGRAVPQGEVGEIVVLGPELFLGYLGDSESAPDFDEDGWFSTGDLGRADDDGYLTIVGRKKDIIIRGGENISAKELEDLLFEHPLVHEVSVVGMPDPEMVERVCAFVVPVDDCSVELEELCSFLEARRIAKQKLPERLEIIEALPKTASGKVQKFRLRQTIQEKVRQEGS